VDVSAVGDLPRTARRIARSAAVLFALFGVGWCSFPVAAYFAGEVPPGMRRASTINDDAPVDAICYIVCGFRLTQSNGLITEIPESFGSGFAVTPDGWILTNGHVVADVWKYWDTAHDCFTQETREREGGAPVKEQRVIWVFFGKGKKYEAKIAYFQFDHASGADMSLLKIERSGGRFLTLSSEPRPKRGSEVTCYGFPDYARKDLTRDDEVRKSLQQERLRALKVTAMVFSNDGNLFASASEDKSIYHGIKEIQRGNPVFRATTFTGAHPDSVCAVAYKGETVLATAGPNGLIKLWSLERGKLAEDLAEERVQSESKSNRHARGLEPGGS
jgi:WD40 repeat protein